MCIQYKHTGGAWPVVCTWSVCPVACSHWGVPRCSCLQALVRGAMDEWRAAMSVVEAEADSGLRHQQAQLLRGVKATLEEQVGMWGIIPSSPPKTCNALICPETEKRCIPSQSSSRWLAAIKQKKVASITWNAYSYQARALLIGRAQ